MKCKYYDCGFCYAPEGTKNNSINGGCFEPEYCYTYLMQNKTAMTEKEHLELEIKQLQTEIEEHVRKIVQLKSIVQVKEQQLQEFPITLQRIIEKCMLGRNRQIQLDLVENILDRVEVEWFPLEGCHELKSYDYSEGWNNCIKKLKERLRE